MKLRTMERCLWVVAATFIIATLWQIVGRPKTPSVAQYAIPVTEDVQMYDDSSVFTAAEVVAAHDPFRLERRPSNIAFGDPPMAAPANTIPRPAVNLALGGTIGGPPWKAIVMGIPGKEDGVLVNVGDTIGGFMVRTVRRDTVIVVAPDTTWILTARR